MSTLGEGLDPGRRSGRWPGFATARRYPLLAVGAVLGGVIVAMGLLAPWITPDPQDAGFATNPAAILLPPNDSHIFGTDQVGRDIFTRVVYAARVSLGITVFVLVVAAIVGLAVGLTAGFFGGKVDAILMRITDVFLAFPALLLAVALAAALSASAQHAAIAIAATWWPWYARLSRAQAASIRHQGYSDAARVIGASRTRQIVRHVLPNAATPVFVQMSLDAAGIILTAATLSYLGLGAQDPTPEWGLMISQGQSPRDDGLVGRDVPGGCDPAHRSGLQLHRRRSADGFRPQARSAMIQVRDLRVRYGDRVVAHVPELDVAARTVVGIAGESGSGKSQTALALMGLSGYAGAEVSGSLTLDGEELTTKSPSQWRQIRGRRIVMIMQSPRAALNPTLRLGVLFARTLRLHGVGRAEIEARIQTALDEVVLSPDILRRYPHQVSGGQAQRFAIALVSALRPSVVIADEPTSALDVTVQAEVIEVLRELRDRHGTALLFISHDLAVISELADSVIVMRQGDVVESGPTRELLSAPREEYTKALLAAVPLIGRSGR
jgi:ABC-type dipeptide/oligopeptide/nickel transport system permease subunit/ABC-type dipeptide/oligopeptide/nickel transport system ATPase component